MRKSLFIFVAAIVAAFAAAAVAAYTPAHAADTAWAASYWNNIRLKGSPAITRSENAVKYDWKGRSPVPDTVNGDRFSVRWTRTASFSATRYLFRAISDDGIRVWIDNKLIIDQWNDHPLQTIVVPYDMTAGDHAIKVEYYENRGDAVANVSWSTVSANPWKVQYYNGAGLKGKPVVTRSENLINYHWNSARPVPSVKASNFSARWVRTQAMAAGKYKFKVTAGGGFRLYLDNRLILDEWYDHGGSASSVNIKVSEGNHKVRLEYYNRSTPALLILGIKPL